MFRAFMLALLLVRYPLQCKAALWLRAIVSGQSVGRASRQVKVDSRVGSHQMMCRGSEAGQAIWVKNEGQGVGRTAAGPLLRGSV